MFRKHHARGVIFVGARSWALAIILSGGNVLSSVLTPWQEQTHEALPTSMEVREVHVLIQRPGFRPKEVIVVTTLVDPKLYPKAKLAQLYQRRWHS